MAKILKLHARSVWDSRGRPTVEAEVAVKGARGRAIAPAGASTGSGEAKSIEVRKAVHFINTEINSALAGKKLEQESVDRLLIALDGTPDKSRLGGNAIVAVSLACAQAAAAAAKKPLWAVPRRQAHAGDAGAADPDLRRRRARAGAHGRAGLDGRLHRRRQLHRKPAMDGAGLPGGRCAPGEARRALRCRRRRRATGLPSRPTRRPWPN